MTARTYRVRVHKPGTINPTPETVDFTLSVGDLISPLTIPSPIVRPTLGRTESVSWTIPVLDTDGIITSNLANPATGRAWLIGRIVQADVEDGDGAWRTLGIGRISEVSETDGPGAYTLNVEDERWVERRSKAFTRGGTTWVYPPVPSVAFWRGVKPVTTATVERVQISGSYVRVRISHYRELPDSRRSWIERDLVTRPVQRRNDGKGNFTHLRLNISGTDYEVVTFDGLDDSTYTASLKPDGDKVITSFHAWLWAPGGVPESANGYLYAPTAPPSMELPLHLGGPANPVYPGPLLWDQVMALYDDAGVRYDPAAFASLPATATSFRVTDDPTLDAWLEANAYQPEGVVPFVDSQGRVAPKSVRLPQDLDPDTLFRFDASNLDRPVEWHLSRRDMVHRIRFSLQYFPWEPWLPDDRMVEPVTGTRFRDLEFGGDGIPVAYHEEVRERTPASGAPVGEEITIALHGYNANRLLEATVPTPSQFWPHLPATDRLGEIERDIFDRYADGPQHGTLYGLLSTESVEPGDFVVIDCDALQVPNASNNARTGLRVVQIMQRIAHADGYDFEFLDVGPKLQPLLKPTLAAAKSGTAPKHEITATLSGVPAGATARVELAFDAAFTEVCRVVDGLANGTHRIGQLPSGRTIYARACSTAPNRIRSEWTATVSVALDALQAPTGITAVAEGRTIAASCTPTEPGHGLVPLLNGEPVLASPLPPGSDSYVFAELAESTVYTVGFRHADLYGGMGPAASTTATTGAATQLDAPRRLVIVQGRSSAGAALPPLFGSLSGIEVEAQGADPAARLRVQVATDPAFASMIEDVALEPGVARTRIRTRLVKDLLHIRARSERDGFAPSPWSASASAYATLLLPVVGRADRFPGGWAFLSLDDNGDVLVNVGSDDPDTDGAYWAVSKTDYPDVTVASTFTPRGQMPAAAASGLTLAPGESAYLTLRFWNRTTGFGQGTRHVVPRPVEIPPIPEYAECQARIVYDESDSEHYVIRVTTVPPNGQVRLSSLKGATIKSGAQQGHLVPSGSKWKFEKPPEGAADGEAVFTAVVPDHQDDDDAVIIPAIGRDTVPLTLRVRQYAAAANWRQFRVSVGDPVDPQRADDGVTITYVQQGTGGTTPASGATIPASMIRETPEASEAAGGFIDFVVTKPAAGTGDGRITFTASRTGRVQDADSADIPEMPPGPAEIEPMLSPLCLLDITEETDTNAKVRIRGMTAKGAWMPMEYRYRYFNSPDLSGPWSSWSNLPNDGAVVTIPKHDRWTTTVQAQARLIGSGSESSVAALALDPRLPGIDPTGRVDGSQPIGGPGVPPLIGVIPITTVLSQGVEPSANLLLPGAGQRVEVRGTRSILVETPLVSLGLRPDDIVSLAALLQGAGAAEPPVRLLIQWRNDDGVTLRSDRSAGVTSTTPTRVQMPGLVIPAGATRVRAYYERDSSPTPAYGSQAMLNRGPVCLAFEEPAWRPGTSPIPSNAKADDGAGPKLLPKGVVTGFVRNEETIVFEDVYDSTPLIIFAGGATYEGRDRWGDLGQASGANWAGTGNQPLPDKPFIVQSMGADASASKFTAKLRLMAKSTPTPRSAPFDPAPAYVIGDTRVATAPAAQMPAVDERYTATFSVKVTPWFVTDSVSVDYEIALEVLKSGTWQEVGSGWCGGFTDSGQKTFDGSITVSVPGLSDSSNTLWRLKIKNILTADPSGMVQHEFRAGVLRWSQDSGALFASMTPGGDADAVQFFVLTGAKSTHG